VNKERIYQIANSLYDCGSRQESDYFDSVANSTPLDKHWAHEADILLAELRGILDLPPEGQL